MSLQANEIKKKTVHNSFFKFGNPSGITKTKTKIHLD